MGCLQVITKRLAALVPRTQREGELHVTADRQGKLEAKSERVGCLNALVSFICAVDIGKHHPVKHRIMLATELGEQLMCEDGTYIVLDL